jgi:hypothetical protein
MYVQIFILLFVICCVLGFPHTRNNKPQIYEGLENATDTDEYKVSDATMSSMKTQFTAFGDFFTTFKIQQNGDAKVCKQRCHLNTIEQEDCQDFCGIQNGISNLIENELDNYTDKYIKKTEMPHQQDLSNYIHKSQCKANVDHNKWVLKENCKKDDIETFVNLNELQNDIANEIKEDNTSPEQKSVEEFSKYDSAIKQYNDITVSHVLDDSFQNIPLGSYEFVNDFGVELKT